MSALVYFNQGIGSLTGQPLFFYLKENLGLPPSTVMYLSSVTTLPWMVKPLYGWLSDTFPLFGYRRKSYMILSGLLGVMTSLAIGLTPVLPLMALYGLLVLDALSGAMKDVAVDGIMVEEGQRLRITGKIQSVQWGSLTLATVITGAAGGWIAEHFDYHLSFLLVALFPALVALLACFYKERPASEGRETIPWKAVLENKRLLLSMLFLFLFWFSPAFGVPVSFKMRDEFHFSRFTMGLLSTVGSACSILGAVWYWRVNRDLNIKKWLVISVLVSGFSTFAYLYLTPTSIWAYAVLFGIFSMAIQLIVMDFSARICPKGKEATVFALITSILNLGTFLSGIAGGKLYTLVGYNWLVILSGVSTFLCLPLIPFLNLETPSFRGRQAEESRS